MGVLKPYLLSEDARAQADFYVQALGGEIMFLSTHGELMGAQNELKNKVVHMCVVVAGGNPIFMADAIEPIAQGTNFSLSIEYKTEAEARDAFDKISAGGRVKYPFALQPFGLYLGEAADQFGVIWMITAEPQAE
ncbi:VOC family protein [Paenibacillus arenilitoris]|uniref:VOC family protein n=1 Tax=Paenibacillus arenilitoris TaxID=2772299 RepID=A0A927CPW9_9BACL|nr:VOC family protein [Paenibacillus arenilitoris]MBD2871350.1 VOC family protein [Paenibacillus arenilitoris]